MVRAGFGIYYNPNQMNSFTFLTNNPPAGPGHDLHLGPGQPDAVVLEPDRPARGPAAGPTSSRRRASCPARARPSGASTSSASCSATSRSTLQYVGSDTVNLDRSFFNNTPTPGPGAVDPRRPSQKFRSRRIISNDLRADYDAVSLILRKRMSHGLQADLHYTWSRTRDMATHSNGGGQTMDNYDITEGLRTGQLGRPAPLRGQLHLRAAVLQELVERVPQVRPGRLADRGRHHAPERHPRQRHVRGRPGQHRHRAACSVPTSSAPCPSSTASPTAGARPRPRGAS